MTRKGGGGSPGHAARPPAETVVGDTPPDAAHGACVGEPAVPDTDRARSRGLAQGCRGRSACPNPPCQCDRRASAGISEPSSARAFQTAPARGTGQGPCRRPVVRSGAAKATVTRMGRDWPPDRTMRRAARWLGTRRRAAHLGAGTGRGKGSGRRPLAGRSLGRGPGRACPRATARGHERPGFATKFNNRRY